MGIPVPRIYDYERIGDPIAPPPVTSDDMITWLKLDPSLSGDPTFEAEMDALILSAIHTAEDMTGRTLQESNFKGYLDCFITGRTAYELRKSQLQSVTSITYLSSGVETTIDSADYLLAINNDYSRVQPVIGKDWPSSIDNVLHSSVWTFVAGYKDGEIPADMITAIKMHVAAMWSHRGDCDQGLGGAVVSRSQGASVGGYGVPLSSATVYRMHKILDMWVGP
jgi:uncharacterized phiE125 gp8 family phage protein